MNLLYGFALGFFVETVVSLDDTISKIPILLGMTKTRAGKIAFAIGSVVAVSVAIAIAIWFSDYAYDSNWFRYLSAGFIFALALSIYYRVFSQQEFRIGKKILGRQASTSLRMIQLIGIGFLVSILTLIDDTIVLIPIFDGSVSYQFWTAGGALFSRIIQIIAIIFFANQMEELKYRRHISIGGLIVIGIFILLGWI